MLVYQYDAQKCRTDKRADVMIMPKSWDVQSIVYVELLDLKTTIATEVYWAAKCGPEFPNLNASDFHLLCSFIFFLNNQCFQNYIDKSLTWNHCHYIIKGVISLPLN